MANRTMCWPARFALLGFLWLWGGGEVAAQSNTQFNTQFNTQPLQSFSPLSGKTSAPSSRLETLFAPQEDVPAVLAFFSARLEPTTVRAGEHARLVIDATIEPGWYIYSVVPQGEFAPPPTLLNVSAAPLEVMGPVYETNPVIKKDKVFDLTLAFHEDTARIYQNLYIPERVSAGSQYLSGKLRYQACNDKICTPPVKVPIELGFAVEDGPVRPAFAYMQRAVDDPAFGSLGRAISSGWGAFLLLAAGFGLLSLLTPCVFPMIPVTVSFFTHEAKRSGGGSLRLALLFGGGIVVSYTGLGLVLTLLAGASGVGRFATSPWVNLAVALFFALFALSLMGLLQFALPWAWVQGLNQRARTLQGPLGVLLMGVAFTATSFTCTMPFVGTLLIAAAQGELLWPLLGMLVFSTVFAAPFFLLALFPQYALRLRGQSGNWLVQLKVCLGAIELMAAVKFLSNADLIWQWGIFDRELTLALWAILAGLMALVLLGGLPWPGIDRPSFWRPQPRLVGAGAFGALAFYFALGVVGSRLDAYTEAYVPPPLQAGLAPGDTLERLEKAHTLPWHTSLEEGLVRAREGGQPVFVDFTGYTCVNCRWMEKNIFAKSAVYETLREGFVLVQLYTDGGKGAERNQKLQIERFQTIALPYYVILAPDNTVLARHAGIMTKPELFLQWLRGGQALLAPKK